MVPAEHLLGECMAKAKSFRCITEANAWRMRSLAGGNARRMQGECLATPVLCSSCCPRFVGRMQSVYGALALDDYELLWDSISECKAKDDEQAKGFSSADSPRDIPLF